MNISIPASLIEAGVGTLLAMFAIKAGYMIFYLIRAWHEASTIHAFYSYENKAALAMFTIAIGMVPALFALWWPLHHRSEIGSIYGMVFAPIFVSGVLISVWGLICLLRSLSRYEWPRWLWLLLAAGAITFGVGLAL